MHYWQLQEAKAKLSEVVKSTLRDGPQGISIRGKKECVILSKEEYDRLTKKKMDFLTLVRRSPLKGTSLNIKRDASLPRKIDI
jgi:prevent-host-death family protein